VTDAEAIERSLAEPDQFRLVFERQDPQIAPGC
jgi:hypothetical protein